MLIFSTRFYTDLCCVLDFYRQDRRKLKVNQLSALCIQRLVRGLLVRQRSSAQLRRHRERIEAEQRRKTRLA